jgi:hypothetical protein
MTNETVSEQPKEVESHPGRRQAYRTGVFVLIGLALLTGLEFVIATMLGASTVFLFVIALAKAGIVLQYFMHVDSLWSEEESH